MSSEHLDQRAVELSKRLTAALDSGDVSKALDLMAELRPIYLAAWNEAIHGAAHGAAHSGDNSGLGGRQARCGEDGVSVSDLLMLELSEYRAGLID
ncbi:MAG: hypothetical protein EA381_00130 [Planctomycetaceae bacterium]|nr:MAG: hypothetical protein EA381_00130 [Planctomycetaceae bacterium]